MSLEYEPSSEPTAFRTTWRTAHVWLTASERAGNNLKDFKCLYLKNGSSQGQNPAVTVLFVPNSLGSGLADAGISMTQIV